MRRGEHHRPDEFDVVVVGSGCGGMSAALAAALEGLSAVVIEQADTYGGTSAVSGGAIWVPCNQHLQAVDPTQTPERAEQYMTAVIGDAVPRERWLGYLRGGAAMVREFTDRTRWMRWSHVPYIDYRPEAPAASMIGRTLEPLLLDGRELGDDLARLRPAGSVMDVHGLPLTASDFAKLNMAARTWEGKRALLRLMARTVRSKLRGERPLTFGQALVGRLRLALRDAGVPLWLSCTCTDLALEDGRVAGVQAVRDGRSQTIRAARGVVLASGGFGGSAQMLERHLSGAVSPGWHVGPTDGQDGGPIEIAVRHGAATAFMDQAWSIPMSPIPRGPGGAVVKHILLSERALPGTIMVNGAGERFTNEAKLYDDLGPELLAADGPQAPTIPSWFIFDQRVKRRYLLLGVPPLAPFPRSWLRSGHIRRAPSIEALAEAIGVPADRLAATVARWNAMVADGRDDDYGKGAGAYDRYYGDPTLPQPNLAPLDRAPFYAVAVYPGFFSTRGGLLADGSARVLAARDGTPIPGLYAVGNAASTPFGPAGSPGPGGSLGPPLVFGYVAGKHLARTIAEPERRERCRQPSPASPASAPRA